MSFSQPMYWDRDRSTILAPHAVSLVVTPATAITSSSVAAATVLTTATPHGLFSGDTVLLEGHTGSTPAIDGTRVVTVLTPLSFSIPVTVTIAGTGGTVTRTLGAEPFSIAEGKLIAGQDWTPGDDRDAMMARWIAAARNQVELDTGLALPTQMRDVYLDGLPSGGTLALPSQSRPLRSVVSINAIDTAGATTPLEPSAYIADLAGGRIGLALGSAWPTDLRPFQPVVIRLVAGWPTAAAMPPALLRLVELLIAHYATAGRDLVSLGHIVAEVPHGYAEGLAPFQTITVM